VGWNSEIVIARLVIVEGDGDGLFIYAGTPGPGNPPVFFVVAPGELTDPFGNQLCTLPHATAVMGAGVPGTGQVVVNDLGNLLLSGADGQDLIRFNPNAQRVIFYSDPPAANAVQSSVAVTQTTDSFGNTIQQGITTYDASGDFVQMFQALIKFMFGGAQVGEIASSGLGQGLLLAGTGGAVAAELDLVSGATPLAILSSGLYLYPANPVSGGVEVKHTFSFAGTWAQAAGRKVTAFRLLSNSEMEICGSVAVPAGVVNGQAITTAIGNTAYTPKVGQSLLGYDTTAGVVVRLFYTTGRVLQFSQPAASVAAGDIIDIPAQRVSLQDT
jgi:hypothetical protein